MRISLSLLLMLLMLTPATVAQTVTPAIPDNTPRPVVTPSGEDDPRTSICTAPTLEGFVPHIVQPGDMLGDFLTGASYLTVTQLAALNCLDDPAALPIGAAIWVPAALSAAATFDTAPETTTAAIEVFNASATTLQNQMPVTFSWQATGTSAWFYHCPADTEAPCQRPVLAPPQPLTHEVTLSDFPYAGPVRYRLEVSDEANTITQDITLDITCSQRWLIGTAGRTTCPEAPAQAIFAAWQPFEHGLMLWFSDTQEIWVLSRDDQRLQVFVDTFSEGEQLADALAPDGLYAPVRGFGKVWQTIGGAEGTLGWATAPETGFDALRQPAGDRSYTIYVQAVDGVTYALTYIPGTGAGLWQEFPSEATES